jgi:hypothetical protein
MVGLQAICAFLFMLSYIFEFTSRPLFSFNWKNMVDTLSKEINPRHNVV